MGFWQNIWGKKIEKADFVQEYESAFGKPIPGIRPISQLKFVILDTETTGLDVKKDQIISFGAIRLQQFRIAVHETLELYLPFSKTDESAMQIHEILNTRSTISHKEFSKTVLKYIGDSILVGHHLGFDLAMLEKTMRPFGLKKILNPVLDTHTLALRIEKGPFFDYAEKTPGEYGLDQLCERFEIALDDRHTAAGDALLTTKLLMKLLKLAEKKGIRDYKDLMK